MRLCCLMVLVMRLFLGVVEAQDVKVFKSDGLESFRSVSLNQMVDDALEHNISLQLARVSSHLANAQVDVAQGAFHPVLSASSTWAKQDLSNDLQTQGVISNFRSQTYGVGLGQQWRLGTTFRVDLQTTRRRADFAGLGTQGDYVSRLDFSVRQPLLQGFGVAGVSLQVAKLAQASAQNREARAVEDMIAQVVQAYLALAELEATERVLQQSVAVAESLLYRNDELFKRELASELDVFTAQSGVAFRQVSLMGAKQARQDASEALVFAVYGERALERMVWLKTTVTKTRVMDVLDLEAAEAFALDHRKDVVAARLDLAQADLFLDASKNGLRPSLDVQSQFGTQGQAMGFGGAFDGLTKGLNGSVGLTFSQAVGNRSDRGKYRQALWQTEQQRLVLQATENAVRQQVRSAVRSVQATLAQVTQAKLAEQFANKQLMAERKRLDLGLGDSFRVLQTEENVAQAELTAIRAQFDFERAMMQYHLALGQLGGQYGQ